MKARRLSEHGSTRRGPDLPRELHLRRLVLRLAEVATIVALSAVAISSLPGLGQVRGRLQGEDLVWIAAIVVAELCSCAGYLLVFRATFCSKMPWRLSYDIAMAEQAANSLLPAGGAGGLALGAWALREAGMPTSQIERRSVAFFVLTSAANFLALVVVGLAAFAHIIPARHSVLLTLVPALITALGIFLAALSPAVLRAVGTHRSRHRLNGWPARAGVRLSGCLKVAADGIDQAGALLRSRRVGVVAGSFAYMAFDIAALGFAFAALGRVPAVGTLVLAYLLGQLGNLVPLPGGIGGTEGALIGVFVLYGVNLTDAAAATLAYRLFQLAIPALLGLPAFVMLRGRLTRADRRAQLSAPLGLERAGPHELAGCHD